MVQSAIALAALVSAAFIVPLLAGLLELANSFRMMRLPDLKASTTLEGTDFG